MIRLLAAILCLVTLLWGCQRTTTVILPPETLSTATEANNRQTTAPPTVATVEPTTAPTAESTTDPTTVPPTVPTTEPTAKPTTTPTMEPATEPTTAPTTEPTTEPTSAPTTAPTTVPTTAPTTAPTTEPTTTPTAKPTTVPTTAPSTDPTRHSVYDISNHTVGSLEYSLLDAVNQQRAAAELPSLSMDSTLCALAAIRSYECADNFSHTRPDGRNAYSVLSDYDCYIWSNLEERIHQGSSSLPVSIIIRGWMNNDAFSASILSDSCTHIGIGVYTVDGITYITCFFAG